MEAEAATLLWELNHKVGPQGSPAIWSQISRSSSAGESNWNILWQRQYCLMCDGHLMTPVL